MSVEVWVAIVALAIAIWQLRLQRNEIRVNGKISSLIHVATMLKDKIEHHEKIIQDKKETDEDWTGHAKRVNQELRPQLKRINNELMKAMAGYKDSMNIDDIRSSLRLDDS